jgi:hypothetical protein
MSPHAKRQAYGCPASLARPPRILVVQRTKHRVLANSQAVVDGVRSLGGDPNVSFFSDGALPAFSEGLRMFGEADVIIAPHGAALTNIVASAPRTLLLEYAPTKLRVYSVMALTLGIEQHLWEVVDAPRVDAMSADVDATLRVYCDFLRRGFAA